MPLPKNINVNGIMFGAGDVDVLIAGRTCFGIESIEWKIDQPTENVYGLGTEPIGIGYGQMKYEMDMTLHKDEIEAMKDAVPNGLLTSIAPFTIVIVTRKKGTTRVITETFYNCRFSNDGQAIKKGDMYLTKDLKLSFLGYERV